LLPRQDFLILLGMHVTKGLYLIRLDTNVYWMDKMAQHIIHASTIGHALCHQDKTSKLYWLSMSCRC